MGREAPADGWPGRVAIEDVRPEVDCGRFPIKRTVGEEVVVTAAVHSDGHDLLAGVLRWRHLGDDAWKEARLEELGNDLWRARFPIAALGRYQYTVEAWVDHFRTWRRDLGKRVQADQDVAIDLLAGAALVEEASRRALGADAVTLSRAAKEIASRELPVHERSRRALDPDLASRMALYPDRRAASVYDRTLEVVADRERARFGSWYEMFPRSAAGDPGRHGTFRDCEERLPYVASMGFDVLYLPPIHPIGHTHRKGKNNAVRTAPGDPGSPWAIGSEEGGHTAIHPALGTIEDFRRLVARARELGLEVALDLAFQCSPDHPWVREHPEWFRKRPDGTIQYAENPPKKYQDIYPLDFETPAWRELHDALKAVVLHWVREGVKIFRVDNPHTKPYPFWEWLIGEVRDAHPDVIFLSEAFTRPRVMARLAKVGFNQSYTYFTWRNSKWELERFLEELTRTDLKEYLRPNLWPNTPDILPESLQYGGRPAFAVRLVLAATLGPSWGVYGPAFELLESRPLAPGREEYLDSEKYEVRSWDLDRPDSLRELIARMNRLRKENRPLQTNEELKFIPVDRDSLIAYLKGGRDEEGPLLVVVNLDPFSAQSGWIDLPLEDLGIEPSETYQVHDLLSDARWFWTGRRNYVELDPRVQPAHVFRIRRRLRSEREFEYFL